MAAPKEQRYSSIRCAIFCFAITVVLFCLSRSRAIFPGSRRNVVGAHDYVQLCLGKSCFVQKEVKGNGNLQRRYLNETENATERGPSYTSQEEEELFETEDVGGNGGAKKSYWDYFLNSYSSQSRNTKKKQIQNNDKTLQKRLPSTLIIGVKKGGTKALLVFLSVHPDIRAKKKECHFFDTNDNYRRGIAWYRNQMPKSYSHQITMEKSPRYFTTSYVPKRVYKMSPDTKLILILRDPVNRAISDYIHMKTRKKHGKITKDIESILWNETTGEFNSGARFLQNSLYASHLKRWLQYFPRDQLHIVNGDELIRNPGDEVVKVQKFLNVGVKITQSDFIFNQQKNFYCIKNRAEELNGIKRKIVCLSKSKGRKHPAVSNKTIQAMRQFFKKHNEELYKLSGKDFGW